MPSRDTSTEVELGGLLLKPRCVDFLLLLATILWPENVGRVTEMIPGIPEGLLSASSLVDTPTWVESVRGPVSPEA